MSHIFNGHIFAFILHNTSYFRLLVQVTYFATMMRNTILLAAIVILVLPIAYVHGFTTVTSPKFRPIRLPDKTTLSAHEKCIGNLLVSAALISAIAIGPNPALADEYGKETEAPTLFTGETVMVSGFRV
jgi:hypothetical protein